MTARVTFITSLVNDEWVSQLHSSMEAEIKTPHDWFVLDNMDKPWVTFAQANNYLASNVETEFIGFLNDDIIFGGDPLPQMLAEFDDPKVGIVGTKLLFPDGTLQHGGVGFGMEKGVLRPGHMDAGCLDNGQADSRSYCAVTFACALTRTSLFKEVKGLSEAYANGLEDLDYCFKIMKAGYESVYVPTVPITHIAHGSRTTELDIYNWNIFKTKWVKELAIIEYNFKKYGVGGSNNGRK